MAQSNRSVRSSACVRPAPCFHVRSARILPSTRRATSDGAIPIFSILQPAECSGWPASSRVKNANWLLDKPDLRMTTAFWWKPEEAGALLRGRRAQAAPQCARTQGNWEGHTPELQSLTRLQYAVS